MMPEMIGIIPGIASYGSRFGMYGKCRLQIHLVFEFHF